MRKQTPWARFAIGGAALSLCVAACDSVLDIEDPVMRPSEAGAGGEPTPPNTLNGGSSSSGSGGDAGNTTLMGGAGAGGEGGAGPVTTTSAGAGSAGEAGAPAMKDCASGNVQCAGDMQKTPQICDESGHWVANVDEAEGDCPIFCAAGKCTECEDEAKRCSVCAEGNEACDTNLPQTCEGGVWIDDRKACANYCDSGVCKTPTSCGTEFAVLNTCALDVSCCASAFVPGGTFFRSFDRSEDFGEQIYEATVGAFFLDKFEVTVGRMRAFVAAFDELSLADGAGKSLHIPSDAGWKQTYALPADKAALIAQLQCDGATWSDSSADSALPINCVPFNVAYAFCIWDGGRLPTEAEWNFGAAGGTEQRVYPWSNPDEIGPTYANYGTIKPVAVGSSPLGNGRWGQSDLAGNVDEWVLDYNQDYPVPCANCLIDAAAPDKIVRGGSYQTSLPFYLSASYRGYAEAVDMSPARGFRCVRELDLE